MSSDENEIYPGLRPSELNYTDISLWVYLKVKECLDMLTIFETLKESIKPNIVSMSISFQDTPEHHLI